MTQENQTPGRRGRKPGSKKQPGSGRKPGTLNKVTLTAKAAIAEFVDGNAHRLTNWLDQVAEGQLMVDKDGNVKYDDDGLPIYIVRPNPEKAFNLFQSVIEYHVPKLARTEVSGVNGGAIKTAAVDLRGLNDTELEQMEQLLSKATEASK